MYEDVACLHDVPLQGTRLVTVKGREIGLLRSGESIFAVRNRCPHQGGPLCKGPVRPLVRADESGAIQVDAAEPMITCPWHGWQFFLRTGRSLWDANYGVRVYPVEVRGDRVFVAFARRDAAP